MQEQFFIVRRKNKEKSQEKVQPKQPIPNRQSLSSVQIQQIKDVSEAILQKKKKTLQTMRFSSQQIANSQQNSKQLVESVTCPICLLILKIPYYECQQCSNNFCQPCITDWWKKNPHQCVFKCEAPEFKEVKRSNTYNALIQTLKIECQHCKKQYSVSDIPKHIAYDCPAAEELCQYCSQTFSRQQLKIHQEECEKKLKECSHCHEIFYNKDYDDHQSDCPQKVVPCKFELCPEKDIRNIDFNTHIQKCMYAPINCKWCEKEQIKLNQEKHFLKCEKRQIECKWCRQCFLIGQIIQHQINCPNKKETCKICNLQIKEIEFKEHKVECLYENMASIRELNDRLLVDNIRLREKMAKIQEILQETIENSKSHTMSALKQMRLQDKEQLERDLLRIDNSIRSVEKLKKQEFEEHMKLPHWIQSWCPLCKILDKKFKDMLTPLINSRKEVVQKMQQMEKFNFTPRG